MFVSRVGSMCIRSPTTNLFNGTAELEVLLYDHEQNLRKDLTSLCFTQTFWIEGQGQIQSDQCNDSAIGAFLLQKIVFIPYASIQDGTNFQNGTSKKQFKTSTSVNLGQCSCMNLHLQSVKTVGIWWHLKWATKSNNTAPCHLNVAHLCHTKFQRKNKTDVYSKSIRMQK